MTRLILFIFSIWVGILHAEPLDAVVAIVNDGVITSSELKTQVEVMRTQLLAKKMAVPEDAVLRKQVLQHLIDVDLQLQLAKQNGIQVDETQLKDALKKIADQNHLTVDGLKQAIEQQGMTWTQFCENIRKEVLLARLQQRAVAKDVVVTKEQVDAYLKAAAHQHVDQEQVYHLQNILIPLSETPTTAEIARAEKKADVLLKKLAQGADFGQLAIAESSDAFALEGGDLGERHVAELPDVFAQKVVSMKVGEVVGPLRTGNGLQLIKLLQVNGAATQHLVTKTHVRHILLKPDASMTKEEAKKQLQNLYQQLRLGHDFARFAKQYSLDAMSAMKGGDLGWVSAGDLVPEFEKAMDKLPLNTVSKPVKTRFGWHLIEVLERKTVDDTTAYERNQVQQFLQQRKFMEAVQSWQQRLRGEAYVQVLDKALA